MKTILAAALFAAAPRAQFMGSPDHVLVQFYRNAGVVGGGPVLDVVQDGQGAPGGGTL